MEKSEIKVAKGKDVTVVDVRSENVAFVACQLKQGSDRAEKKNGQNPKK